MVPTEIRTSITNIFPYIKKLTDKYREIQSIWLFGSRANGASAEQSDWDLMIFATARVLHALSGDIFFRRNDIDLLIVFNGNDFQAPWPTIGQEGRPVKSGSLQGLGQWNWKMLSDVEATYIEAKERPGHMFPVTKPVKAWKIWPESSTPLKAIG